MIDLEDDEGLKHLQQVWGPKKVLGLLPSWAQRAVPPVPAHVPGFSLSARCIQDVSP